MRACVRAYIQRLRHVCGSTLLVFIYLYICCCLVCVLPCCCASYGRHPPSLPPHSIRLSGALLRVVLIILYFFFHSSNSSVYSSRYHPALVCHVASGRETSTQITGEDVGEVERHAYSHTRAQHIFLLFVLLCRLIACCVEESHSSRTTFGGAHKRNADRC